MQVADVFLNAVRATIEKQAQEAKEQVITEAVKDFEAKLRKSIAGIVLNVANYYSVQTFSDHLVIDVRLKDK